MSEKSEIRVLLMYKELQEKDFFRPVMQIDVLDCFSNQAYFNKLKQIYMEDFAVEIATDSGWDIFLSQLYTRLDTHRQGKKYIYFIQGEIIPLIKIGQSHKKELFFRIATHQTGSPDLLKILGLIEYYPYLERDIHIAFAFARKHGEWFEPVSALLSFIQKYTFLRNM